MRKILIIISYFTLVLVAVCMAVVFYWLFNDYEPIIFNEVPFNVETKEVKQGEYLVYDINYCKTMETVPYITRTFVDGIIYSVPQEPQPFLKMGCQTIKMQIYIPKALPEGEYVIKATYSFKVNPIRTVDIYTQTQNFVVTN